MRIVLTIISVAFCQTILAQNLDSLLRVMELNSQKEISKDKENLSYIHRKRHPENIDSLLLNIELTEISELSKQKEHLAFFFQIAKVDEGIRELEVRMHKEFGFRSKQHDSINERMVEIDRFLFNQVQTYLEMHPYPDSAMGHYCYTAPCVVFNHAPNDPSYVNLKIKNFHRFYQSYQKGDLYSGLIWTYLFRLHEHVLGSTYQDRDLGEVEQIEDMIDILKMKRK